jgi:deazaflavin-dependent oxidoreductase (nitroreductase family)
VSAVRDTHRWESTVNNNNNHAFDQNRFNVTIIDEFRANAGRVGGPFEGAPLALIHHEGRRTGKKYVSPAMYLSPDDDDEVIYVFASFAGAPDHPDWYRNLTAAGKTTVEVGTDTYPVAVAEVEGAERDRIYAEQARRFPGFAEYEEKTRGLRTIPVLALQRI